MSFFVCCDVCSWLCYIVLLWLLTEKTCLGYYADFVYIIKTLCHYLNTVNNNSNFGC